MALDDPYATSAELKSRMAVTVTTYDTPAAEAVIIASREIDEFCNRQFNKTTSATARTFITNGSDLAYCDDFHTTTGLVIKTDTASDGLYATTWAAADYELQPLNNMMDGVSGWPFYRIVATRALSFLTASRRAGLQVTAQWGWTAVPPAVKESCLILAEEMLKLKDAPFGVAGFGQFGAVRIRNNNPKVAALLNPYRRTPVLVG